MHEFFKDEPDWAEFTSAGQAISAKVRAKILALLSDIPASNHGFAMRGILLAYAELRYRPEAAAEMIIHPDVERWDHEGLGSALAEARLQIRT